MAEPDIPVTTGGGKSLQDLNAAWMQGETVVMRYDTIPGDPGYQAEGVPEADRARGRLAALTNFSSTVTIPQTEQAQVGERRFAHGIRLEEVRCNFNATVGLLNWIRFRNTRASRRLPLARFSFELRDNQTDEAIRRWAFNGYLRDRVLDGPVASEAVPVTVQAVIQVGEDDEPAIAEDALPAVGANRAEPDLPTLADIETKWIQGETVEMLYDALSDDPVPEAGADAEPTGRLATLTRITMSKTHPQQELPQIGSRRFAHGVPLSTITPRFNATAGLLDWSRHRLSRSNRVLPRSAFALRATDNLNASLTAKFNAVVRGRDIDAPVTTDGRPVEMGLTLQVTDQEETAYA